jgi:DNA-binding transcriptional ArsR family regulator
MTPNTNSVGESVSPLASPWAGLGAVVPVPAILLDRMLPVLTDNELRVLLIIIRQTLGWVSEGARRVSEENTRANPHGRKYRDWISQSQMMAKTGKSRDSVSRATGSLLEAGLIVVENQKGVAFATPKARRLARTRFYYRLDDRWFQSDQSQQSPDSEEVA